MAHVQSKVSPQGSLDPKSSEELLPLVYGELRQLAAARLARLPPGQTLQATVLVHEAWLRLTKGTAQTWNHRGHFFAAAAEAMRRIVVERARRMASLKRGCGRIHISLDHADLAMETEGDVVLALNEALCRYKLKDPEGAKLIELRFFAGLSNQQAAEILGLGERSAKRTWAFARAWLYREIQKSLA